MTPRPLKTESPTGAYLDLLARGERPDSLLEVRTRRPGESGMRRWFVRVDARERLARLLPVLAHRADVYVGCAPREYRSGTSDAITHSWVAWVDVDGPGGHARLTAVRPAPTLILASGSPGGVHAYWRLDRAADAELVEELNRRLAHACGGDPVCAAGSILRPPGTRNHKRQPPATVHAIGGTGLVHDPDGLLQELAPVPGAALAAGSLRGPRRLGGDPLLQIAPPDYVHRLLGVVVPRSGFIACPLHQDERPSLKVYATPAAGWYCYSAHCRRGGSIYDLAAALWGLSTRGPSFTELRARLRDLFPEARS